MSCVTAAIVFPTTLFVTAIFKSSNTKKKKKEEEVADTVFKEYDDIDELLGEIYEDEEERRERVKEKEPSQCERCCDKTLLIMAWTVANLGVISSAFFVILYSMQWGSSKSNKWLVSFLLSFVQNAFFADPIKVSIYICKLFPNTS